MDIIYNGDVYICDFSMSANGSMQGGMRPCVIIDNNMACAFSPCIHCVPLTSKTEKNFALHYPIDVKDCDCLDVDSVALCEQYTLIDKTQLKGKIGNITKIDLLNIVELCKKNFPFEYTKWE